MTGLGRVSGAGVGGTLTEAGANSIFEWIKSFMHGHDYVLIDMGAGDGSFLARGIAHGVMGAVGIELGALNMRTLGTRSPVGSHTGLKSLVKHYNNRLRDLNLQEMHVVFAHGGAEILTSLDDLVGIPYSHLLKAPRVVYAFCDGWNTADRHHMVKLVAEDAYQVKLFIMSLGHGVNLDADDMKTDVQILGFLNEYTPPGSTVNWIKAGDDFKGFMAGSGSQKTLYFFCTKDIPSNPTVQDMQEEDDEGVCTCM